MGKKHIKMIAEIHDPYAGTVEHRIEALCMGEATRNGTKLVKPKDADCGRCLRIRESRRKARP